VSTRSYLLGTRLDLRYILTNKPSTIVYSS
jgi:hypothetical protein